MSQPTLRLSVAKASSGSVLLVQDRKVAKPYIEALAEAGYNVVIAPNTKVALEEAMLGAFDVVLCDVDVEGGVVDMLSIIQAYEPHLPLVLLGEDAPPSSSHSIETLNLLVRLPKPVVVAEALRIVEVAMDVKRESKPGIDLRTEGKDVTPFTSRVTAPAMAAPGQSNPTPQAFPVPAALAAATIVGPPLSGIPSSTGASFASANPPVSVKAPVSEAPITPQVAISMPVASGVRSKTRAPTLIAFKPDNVEPEAAPVPSDVGGRSLEELLAEVKVELEPIFDANEVRVTGYEARVKADETAIAAYAATSAAKVMELFRRRVRELAVRLFTETTRAQMKLFVDITTSDLLDNDLYAPEAPLSQIAERVVLQLRGGNALAIDDLGARASVLRFLGFRIALGGLDTGGSRLSIIGELAPEYMKLDPSLIKDIHVMPAKRRVVEGLMTMCRLLGTTPVAEGVVSVEERTMLVAIGCSLVQGPLHTEDPTASAVGKPRWSRVRTPAEGQRAFARTGSR